jgi:hypothetical protein
MPSKRESLEQLLDKTLSKTPDQARRENKSISSILERFGGSGKEQDSTLPSLNADDSSVEQPRIVSDLGMPNIGIPNNTIPKITTPIITTPNSGMPEVSALPVATPVISRPAPSRRNATKKAKGTQSHPPLVDSARGWLALPNDVVDKVFPTLSLPEQAILLRMYRLSRGYGSESCTIGYVTLGKLCNITRNTVKSAVKSLIASGWIECTEQGAGADHSTYRVKLPSATVVKYGTPISGTQKFGMPDVGIPNAGMARDDKGVPFPGIPANAGIPGNDPIKETHNNKEITHTTQGVSAISRFSLEECRRYANHLKATGQGITNPGGYATKIFRSGEADALIEAFLNPPAQLDITKCADCRGTGFIYIDPSNHDRGVKSCKHNPLRPSTKS